MCPISERLKLNGVVQRCTRNQVQANGLRQFVDTCGSGYVCMPDSPDPYNFPKSVTGFCCPRLKSYCPMGLPTNQKCSFSYPLSPMPMPFVTDPNHCNGVTHYCFGSNFTATFIDSDAICCPHPCSEDEAYYNGLCVSRVGLGKRCGNDDQCNSGQCGPKGT